MHTLETYGWNAERAETWKKRQVSETIPARVVADFGQNYKIATPDRYSARIAGSLIDKVHSNDMPKIGDWVAVQLHDDEPATIHEVLPRSTEIVRGQAGRLVDKQVVAANVDVALIMQPLDHDFSVERLERYVFQLASQNISTIILLNKVDTVSDAPQKQAELEYLAVPSIIMSAKVDESVAAVQKLIKPGKTAVIMGSSGAGKSTLTNRLLGSEQQATAPIRERDSKGRHTTVHRELFALPSGGMIIDTPGIRELQLWGDASDLDNSFPDIAAAIIQCKFRKCSHTNEPGCKVREGIASGAIDASRYRTYVNFKQELVTLESRRGFIAERRSQQTKESLRRRERRSVIRSESDEDWLSAR